MCNVSALGENPHARKFIRNMYHVCVSVCGGCAFNVRHGFERVERYNGAVYVCVCASCVIAAFGDCSVADCPRVYRACISWLSRFRLSPECLEIYFESIAASPMDTSLEIVRPTRSAE